MLLVTFVSASVAQQPFNTGPAQGRQITLRQQLTTGLRAFTKADLAFIDKVVKAVEQGKLPRAGRQHVSLGPRPGGAKVVCTQVRPMVFFQPGLTLRARRFNIPL